MYCKKTGKKKYDKRGAQTLVNARAEYGEKKLRIYPCEYHWHLASIRVRGKRRK